MKKSLHLLVYMVIVFILLSGCTKLDDTAEKEAPLNQAPAHQSIDTTDWQLTTYDTVNNLDDVIMTVKEDTASPTSLTVIFKNNSGSECIYGEFFTLERRVKGNWYQVPVTIEGNYGFDDIGYPLASGQDSEWAVEWDWLYGHLDAGEYRIIKNISDFSELCYSNTYYLAAEFLVN